MFWGGQHFEFSDIPDMTGKVAIITGSNTGIGKVCAIQMAKKNCHIVVACRNTEKGQKVVDEIKAITGKDNSAHCMKLDLLSLAAVKEFADEFTAKYDTLHCLMNNAGVMNCPYGLSKDGLEMQFGTNHVAHYYLTMLLLPLLEKSAPSRIINVSSHAHYMTWAAGINYDTLHDEKYYNRWLHYGKSKAANILFTRELAKRLKDKGVNNVYVNTNHPGAVKTDLHRHGNLITRDAVSPFFITPELGALTQLYLATSPDVETKDIKGQYYVPYAKPSTPNYYCRSDKNAKELWDYTEKLLKEKAPGYTGSHL
ncbi:retinol dehydrogenase 12 [Lichtheimia corymbifera JMRC:FSU:9682]|uniref:Retinol dehydrogenase 12 n=1 Tax=Lichtheimia corymbifera JMRC:FSU:9682 TaxID=1263082 RepID=A0A068RJ49_9FUNG|nr:retinol dehydrogenase 12 [Lichtheimia corymbifera JMRC:FSU:9682]